MFDAGFLEMLVIGVIALLVVGPERLPGLARKVGAFVARAKAFISSTKADIEKELQAEELKSMLSNQEKEIQELRSMMRNTQQTIQNDIATVENQLRERRSDSGQSTVAVGSDLIGDEMPVADKKTTD